jgi:MbtH protein
LEHARASRTQPRPDRKRSTEFIHLVDIGAPQMSNPFDDQGGVFVVLINDQDQHSLWPAAAEIPAGWSIACEQSPRQACIEYVNENWTDMRPETGADIQRG